MSQVDERREATRVPIEADVRLEFSDLNVLMEECSTNISLGGMFIASDKPQTVGTTVRFELVLEDGVQVISGSAVVAWTRQPDQASENDPAGMGVQFVDLEGVSKAIIFRIVDTFIQERDGEPFSLAEGP